MMVLGFLCRLTLGPVSSFQLVIFIAVLQIIFNFNKVNQIFHLCRRKSWSRFIVMMSICFLIALMHAMGTQQPNCTYFEPVTLIIIVFSIIVMMLWSVIEFKSIDRFLLIVTFVGIFQSGIVLLSVVNPNFQQLITENFMSEQFLNKVEEASISHMARTAGLGIAWSSGSIVMAYTGFALLILKVRNRLPMLLFCVFYILIMGATALMGRTGLLLEILFLLYYAIASGKIRIVCTIALILLGGVLVLWKVLQTLDPLIAEATQSWMLGFLDSDSVQNTNSGIVKDGFPPFSLDFIFGTGVEFGNFGSYSFYSDSGYIKTYTSIGVVGMICYYGGLLILLMSPIIKPINKKMKRFIWVAIVALYFVEYKEPFIAMFVYHWFILSVGMLINIETRNNYEGINSRRLCAKKSLGRICGKQ